MLPSRSEVVPFDNGTSAQPVRSFRKPTILVAEDSADSREMMCILLKIKGYEVFAAGDGVSAVELALGIEPDLILIDLQLPKLDGLGVARRLRFYPKLKKTPIVIVSAHDPSAYRQAASEVGCNDYLQKPIDFDRLDKLLSAIIPPYYHAAPA